jgi:acetylornithine/succinyldiaminopimelate/putrescine aminotransferase
MISAPASALRHLASATMMKAAVSAQLNKLQHTSNRYYNRPPAQSLRAAVQKNGMSKVFFGNSAPRQRGRN